MVSFGSLLDEEIAVASKIHFSIPFKKVGIGRVLKNLESRVLKSNFGDEIDIMFFA